MSFEKWPLLAQGVRSTMLQHVRVLKCWSHRDQMLVENKLTRERIPSGMKCFLRAKLYSVPDGTFVEGRIVSTNIMSLRDNNELFKDKIAHFARGGHIIPQKNNLSKAVLLKL